MGINLKAYLILIVTVLVTLRAGAQEQGYPDMINIDTLEDIFYPVAFDHDNHARMEQMSEGCVVCHHYAEDEEYTACAECHSDDPAEASIQEPTLNGAYHRNCLACHREWSNDSLCETCHQQKKFRFNLRRTLDKSDIFSVKHPHIGSPEIVTLHTPDEAESLVTFHHKEHIELYRYKCVRCHRSESCSTCHDYQGPRELVDKSLKEHHEPCQNCHATENEDHCSFCHQHQVSSGFKHDLTGWPLKAYHATRKCTDCHGDQKPIQALTTTCTACHKNFEAGLFDHAKTGFQLSEEHLEIDCYDCHLDETYASPPECLECHDEEYVYPAYKPGEIINVQ